jgi:UDP-3-O-[3-hydroxymyristoyl] glucosamine N-acyltransferase
MLTAGEVAARVGARVVGDAGRRLAAVAPIETAGPEELAFVANPRYAGHLATTRAGAVIVAPAHLPADGGGRTWLVADDAYLAVARALALFHPERRPAPGVHPTAWVDPTAAVAEGATVGPLCSVGARSRVAAGAWLVAGVHLGEEVEVGEGSTLHPNVTVYGGCRIGRRVTLHGGTTIGADGFGFARTPEGAVKVPQVGRVVLEDDVEIGANCAVDRATLGETRIGRGAKIDNLVQIAHNVQVGAGTVIVAQAGIAGSTRVGPGVTIAGQAGVVGHVEVGDRAIVTAQTGVSGDVPAGAVVSGSPHMPHATWRRVVAALADLPALRQRVRALERRLGIGGSGQGKAARPPSEAGREPSEEDRGE